MYSPPLFIYHSLPAELAIPPVNFCIARLLSFLARTVGIQSGQRCARDPPRSTKIKPAKPLRSGGSGSKNQARPSVLIFPLK